MESHKLGQFCNTENWQGSSISVSLHKITYNYDESRKKWVKTWTTFHKIGSINGKEKRRCPTSLDLKEMLFHTIRYILDG